MSRPRGRLRWASLSARGTKRVCGAVFGIVVETTAVHAWTARRLSGGRRRSVGS